MAEISKQALKVVNNTNFPNNNSGEISPSDLRSFNVDMIDSLVDELSYNADSASWNSSISALNTFTSSQQPSFAALNAFTASASQSIQALNSFTSSADSRLDSLEAETAALESFTSSINQIQDRGVVKGTSTRLNFGGGAFVTASIVPNVNGAIADITINSDTTKTDTGSFNAYTASTNARINSLEAFTASLDTNYASQAEFNAYTASNDSKVNSLTAATASYAVSSSVAGVDAAQQSQINSLIAATGSYVSSAITASSLVTASFDNGTRNLTFTKGDASTFAVNIPDVSGSTFNTGSFATTGSNSFIGNQNIIGGLSVSSSTEAIAFTGSTFTVNTLGGGAIIFRPGTSIQFQGNTDFTNPGRFPLLNVDASGSGYYGFNNEIVGRIYQDFSGSVDARINAITGSGGGSGSVPAGTVSSSAQITDYGIFATLGGNTFTSSQTITTAGNTDVTIQSTAVSGQTNLVLDAFQNNVTAKGNLSFTNNGQFGGSGSVKFISTLNNIEFASDAGTRIGPTNGGGNGINTQAISLQSHSGSLSLAPAGFANTTASLSHISSSSGTNFVNLVFKTNNNTFSTIVSGSGNIWNNTAAPSATFVRYIGGSSNLLLTTGSVPQLSGSATVYPVFTGNIGTGTGTYFFRPPASSSAWTVAHNYNAGTINFGTSAAASMVSASAGLNYLGNIGNATVGLSAFKTTLTAPINVLTNALGGTVTLNMDSSSIILTNSTVQGALRVDNSYSASGAGTGNALAVAAGSAFFGVSNALYASGSNTTVPVNRSIIATTLIGTHHTASVNLLGDNSDLIAVSLIGHGLSITGSSAQVAGPGTAADRGTVLVGRFNAQARSNDTVFAVGTGTSYTGRRTGLLIDSGSNSYFEGSLNVSGSTILSGSAFINNLQNGITDVLVTYNTATGELRKATAAAVISSSFDAAEFWSTTTQSGSAGVSGSITFNNSGSVAGISVVNNSQVTITQDGTYNIQFSAQIETSAGADTMYMWFKKNGVNISDSASKVVLANNTAQIMTVNLFDSGVANDYYELAYQTTNGNARVLYEPAAGNIPTIPSVILTIQQLR
jgi:hypothetical protein